MPSAASLAALEVKTRRRWLSRTMSESSGQSPPFLGMRQAGKRNLERPEALSTRVSPIGDST
uniref:Uncharacterized protein n=1 Tax=Arundo donax TaxID=35708 RepID=A0A0A9DSK7_ARUDO